MSLAGRKPTEDRSQVRNRMPAVHEWQEFPNVPYATPPKLPPRRVSLDSPERTGVEVDQWTDPQAWPSDTKRWYKAISTMPHAVMWTAGDWEQVFATAECHARFYEGWKGYNGSELRQREKLLGTTYDARRDLRIRYVDAIAPAPASGGNVTRLDDFRDL